MPRISTAFWAVAIQTVRSTFCSEPLPKEIGRSSPGRADRAPDLRTGPIMTRSRLRSSSGAGSGPELANSLLQLRQLGRHTVGPPIHAHLAAGIGPNGEAVDIRLIHFRAPRQDNIAFVVFDRPGKHIEAGKLSRQHLSQPVLYCL